MQAALVLEDLLDTVRDHGDGDFVLDAARDDQVGDFALRLHVFVEVGLHEGKPLLDAAFDVAAAVADVADDLLAIAVSGRGWWCWEALLTSSGEAEVAVGFGEYLYCISIIGLTAFSGGAVPSGLACPAPSGHVVRRCPPGSGHAASKSCSSYQSSHASERSISELPPSFPP